MADKKLDQQQRAWLDAALKAKGRFTRAAAIRSDWEDYRRRRDKVEAAMAGILPGSPQAAMVKNGLASADALAKDGKFAEAYKGLDSIKTLAKGASAARAATISTGQITTALNIQRSALADLVNYANFAFSHFQDLIDRVDAMPEAGGAKDLAAALGILRDFAKTEVVLRGELAGRRGWMQRVRDMMAQADIATALDAIDRDIAAHVAAGHADALKAEIARMADLRARLAGNGGRYADPSVLTAAETGFVRAFEEAVKAIKDISKFQTREGAGATDPQAQAAQAGLKQTDNLAEVAKGKEKWQMIEDTGQILSQISDLALGDTSKVPLRRAKEPAKFDADAALFNGTAARLFPGQAEIPDDIPLDKAEALVADAKAKLTAWMATADPRSDTLFDLVLKSEQELAVMVSEALTGIAKEGGASQSHAACFKKMAAELKKEIARACPNKVAADGASMTLNGTAYQLQGMAGEGGNGKVRRFVDPATGKTVAVKSMKGDGADPEKRAQLVDEMRIHRKALSGDPAAQTDDSNLLALQGAAVSDDGSLHMVMEDVEGGDLGAVANAMTMMTAQGTLPEEARKVLALDFIAQATKGMKAMAERGLVHNDLKPQNMLLGKDGKVKIMDFGESRFVDDQEEAPSSKADGFLTTPGYEAPEQFKGKRVDQKADAFALAGIANILTSQDADEMKVGQEMKPVSALGRVVAGLQEADPKKRPSLDAVMTSALLDQIEGEHDPADVEALRKASGETAAALGKVKAQVAADDFQKKIPRGTGMDAMWKPYVIDVSSKGGEVPIAALQTIPTKIDAEIAADRKRLAKAPAEEAAAIRAEIKAAEEMKAFWLREIERQLGAARDEGKAEVETVLKDDAKTVDIPGHGKMSAPKAVKLREEKMAVMAGVKRDFEAMAADNPEMALAWVDKTNAELAAMQAEIAAIGQALAAVMGPKARFVLAEAKLKEVGARFGPARGKRPAPAPEPAAAAPAKAPRPTPAPGEIPEPPPMPKKKEDKVT